VAVSFNAGVFTDSTGKTLGILAAARDITAQKALEGQLRDSQSYTRSLIESNIDALMTTDPLGVISDVNQQMEALTASTREELIGSPFKGYFTDPVRAEEGIRLVLQEGRVTDYELTARAKGGVETEVSYNAATFFDPSGSLQGVFAAARDITERKRFEKELQEKNVELENASLAKDRFLANMSHELRTPLNAIIGFTGTLLMELPGPLTSEQEKQLRTVQRNGRHLLSIINDLLDLAKIESGKVSLSPEPFNCQELVQEIVAAVEPMAEEKGIDLGALVPDEEVIIVSDRRAVSQILLNFANNAVKFTDHGQVRIELVQALKNGSLETAITVRDTGPGIPVEDQERLFEAFERGTQAVTRPREGTGLGLYISRRLAELLGSRIEFESMVDEGSTFTLVLGSGR
jgi:PAS domain S-box-containing protein